MSLRIIATGGTFDKQYEPNSGQLLFQQSALPAVIARARFAQAPALELLMAIDSLDMQDAHRQQILQACARSAESRIVIVHGTDTMRETAELLGKAALDKTIVLTGAMLPYRVADSDALFNFGFACAAAQLAGPGVSIAMNAQLFPWHAVRKNRAEGRFERND